MTISHLIFYSNYGKLLPGSSSYFVWYFQHDMLTCFGCLTMMLSSDLSNKAIFSRIVDVEKKAKDLNFQCRYIFCNHFYVLYY